MTGARDHDPLSTAPAELLMEHEFWHPGGHRYAFRLGTTRRTGPVVTIAAGPAPYPEVSLGQAELHLSPVD